MTDERLRTFRKITSQNAWICALGFILVGVLLLLLSGSDGFRDGHPSRQAFICQLGGLLIATGLLTVCWEARGRRTFADEILAITNVSGDITRAGIRRVTGRYLEEVAWAEWFRDVHELDIVVAYARTWRHTHHGRLETAVRSGATVRVFLPDPGKDLMVRVLADRFGSDADTVRREIEDSVRFYQDLGSSSGNRVQVRLHTADPVFSCYRFDGRAVITLYSHARERRTHVPTLVVGEGDLYDFVRGEIEALVRESELSRRS